MTTSKNRYGKAVRRVVKKARSKIDACYQAALRRDPALSGAVVDLQVVAVSPNYVGGVAASNGLKATLGTN